MNLKTTQFSDLENKKKYILSTFNEMGIDINILNEVTKYHKIPSGNFYKFGVVVGDGNYYWYFNGTPVANDRTKMREIFSAILMVTKPNETPFIYKVKRL
ncbi:MAG: hypothetical protein WCJ62_12560 [Flavobacterium sp.]